MTEAWPDLPTPPDGAPNVVVILLEDVGYGQTSTFGGPVPMQELDALAGDGLRFTRFHATAICGSSRAALITGRNHHNAGAGFLAEWATGCPNYDNIIPRSTATMGAIMGYNCYAMSWFGKDHNTRTGKAALRVRLIGGPLGFDYFCGFIRGETHQYYPVLFERLLQNSDRQSMRSGGLHAQADTRPLPHDELVQRHCVPSQAWVTADPAGQEHDLA